MARTPPRLPPLLDLPRVANTLDVSVKTVRRWIERGDLRAHRLGQGANLATVLALVREDSILSKRQRQDFASALRTVANALGCPLETLPAHPNLLHERLKVSNSIEY